MKRFFESFASGSDKFTISQSNMFKVMFQTDFGNVYGAPSTVSDELDLVIQSIDLPNLVVGGHSMGMGESSGIEINNDYVEFVAPANSYIKPEKNSFTITILNTLENPVENIFLPWMENTASTKNKNYPFFRTILNVFIFKNDIKNDFAESDVKFVYEFDGVYPTYLSTPTLSHDISRGESTRTIGFKFNMMKLKYNNVETFVGK